MNSFEAGLRPYEFLGLKGRYGHWAANNTDAKRTFVLILGQHATIERGRPIVEALQEFGDVYIADNPGFGGMESSYKVGRYPDLTFFGEHVRHFIENYTDQNRKLTIFGISFGFQVAVEALHHYPELSERVEDVVSFVGFVSHHDFHITFSYSAGLIYILANIGRTWLGSEFLKFVMKERLIVGVYQLTKPIQVKFKHLKSEEAKRYAKEQAYLWVVNDIRTHGATAWDLARRSDQSAYRLDTPLLHIGVPNDHMFDNKLVVSQLQEMFPVTVSVDLQLENHAPLDVDTADSILGLLPEEAKAMFAKSHNQVAITRVVLE